MPCPCCEVVEVASIELQWDSVSASKTKCGFTVDGVYYRMFTVTESGTTHVSESPGLPYDDDGDPATDPITYTLPDYTADESYSRVTISTKNSSCVTESTCSGGASLTESDHALGHSDSSTTQIISASCASTTATDCTDSGTLTISYSDPRPGEVNSSTAVTSPCAVESCTPELVSETATLKTYSCSYSDVVDAAPATSGHDFHGDASRTEEYSDEYTDADLITITEAALPDFDGDFDDTAGSVHALTSGGTSFSVRLSKWRIKHSPTPTCYLKIWLRTKFVPFSGSTVYTDISSYVWSATGTKSSPCYDTSESVLAAANDIYSMANDLTEPATNGAITVEIVKWSYLADYTPDDPNTDLSRPYPDVNPNGFPA